MLDKGGIFEGLFLVVRHLFPSFGTLWLFCGIVFVIYSNNLHSASSFIWSWFKQENWNSKVGNLLFYRTQPKKQLPEWMLILQDYGCRYIFFFFFYLFLHDQCYSKCLLNLWYSHVANNFTTLECCKLSIDRKWLFCSIT